MDANVLRHSRVPLILTAALVGLVAWAALPGSANADVCQGGEFCLWQHADRGGGDYSFSGSDSNLHNDLFASGVLVGDNASTAHNAGNPDDPSGLVDVLAYKDVAFGGPALCVPIGTTINNLNVKGLPSDKDVGETVGGVEPDGTWNDDISSYRWVANC